MTEPLKRYRLDHVKLSALPPAMKQELAQLQAANYMWMTTHKELEANYNAVCKQLDPLRQRSEQLDALTLRWSRDTPTKPGWYWWRNEHADARVLQAQMRDGILLVDDDSSFVGEWKYMLKMDGEWAGPIAPPIEPPQ